MPKSVQNRSQEHSRSTHIPLQHHLGTRVASKTHLYLILGLFWATWASFLRKTTKCSHVFCWNLRENTCVWHSRAVQNAFQIPFYIWTNFAGQGLLALRRPHFESLFAHPHLILTPTLLQNRSQNHPQTINKCNTKHTQKVYSKLLILGSIMTNSKRQESKRQLQGGGGGASAARRLRYISLFIILKSI